MKYSLSTTLVALTTMTLTVITSGSSSFRGLQEASSENVATSSAPPSIKISGVSTLLQILNSVANYSNSTFDIITIDSFLQTITDQGVAIQGKITITNDQNEDVTGLINGSWDQTNNKIVLTATKYEEPDSGETTTDSSNSTIDDDGYTPLAIDTTVADSPVSAAFNWGIKALIEKGERQDKIPISDYSVTEWTSAASKNLPDGVAYKFVAELLGANYVHVEANMTVVYSNADQSYSFNGYSYKATNISEGSLPNNFTDYNTSTDINNGTNNTNTTIVIPGLPENYTYISPADLANNTIAQNALAFAIDAIIQKAISQYKLPAASPQYNVTNLILAAYKNTSSGVNFNFQTNLTNALKYKVDANMTVAYRSSNGTYKLNGYAFRSYNYPSGAIVIPPNNTNNTNNGTNSTDSGNNSTNNATTNNTSPSNGTVPDNSTVGTNSTGNATQPVNNSTTNTTAPVNNSTTNSTGNTTTPANNTNPVNNTTPQMTPDNYTIETPAKFANDSIAQNALQYGNAALIQAGISKNKIPGANANYTVANLTLAAYKRGNIGTSYKFQVNMINVDYVHVDANMTVFYRYSTKGYSLNGYSYHSYNYSSTALNNTNPNIPPDMDPPLYDNGSGDIVPIIEPDGSSGAR